MTDETGDAPHGRHVANGFCPSIHPSKAWCNGLDGHVGPHWAVRISPPPDESARLEWPEKG